MKTHQEPFVLYKRDRKGYGSFYYYSINESSGLPSDVCRKEQRKSTGCGLKADATRFVLDRIRELEKRHNLTKKSLREYMDPYFVWTTCPHVARLLDEQKIINEQYVKARRSIMERYIFPDDLLCDKTITEIRRGDIVDFRRRLLDRSIGFRTVNVTVGIVKTIFKEALYREDIDRDPTAGVGNIKYKARERGIFTKAELRELFQETPGYWRDLKAYCAGFLMANTGVRTGELLALRWQAIEETNLHIEAAFKDWQQIGLPKWEKTRTIPISTDVLDVLEQLRDDSIRVAPDDFVFAYDDGKNFGRCWFRSTFVRALKAMEIPRVERSLSPHSLRHSLNSILLNEGCNIIKVQYFFGWSPITAPVLTPVHRGYTHIGVDDLRELIPVIQSIFS